MMTAWKPVGLLAALLLVGGCAQSGTKYAADLISREVLFGNPEKFGPQISPDGTMLAHLAPVDGVLNLWVGPVDDPGAARPVTSDADRGIRVFRWAYTNRHLVYLQDRGGDENWRVYCVDLTENTTKDLTPLEGVAARIQHLSPKHPDEILVALNDRVPQFHDLYRVNLHTGERTPAQLNTGFAGFVTDDELQARFAVRMLPDGGSEILHSVEGAWQPFATIAQQDSLTTSIVDFDKTAQAIYMLDSRDRDTSVLRRVHLDTGETEVLAAHPRVDVDRVLLHPTEKTVEAVGFDYLRHEWQFLDLRAAADFDLLRTRADSDVQIASRSLDDQHWIAALVADDGPVRYYHLDRSNRRLVYLFSSRPELEKLELARMVPVAITAGDGMELVCYLTLPVGTDPDGDGKPAHPLPMVLLVHGGPWARDSWGYHSFHQWLANRGYAVLSVNFRGSTGFGKAFLNAGDKQWGGTMQNDLLDAVHWAVARGVADRDRVAIMGGSYGGYATLVGLAFTPDVFACGVDIVGPSNLITLLESIPPYWTPLLNTFVTRIGDHRTEEGRKLLTERSPLTRADHIRRPLLIAQGANDPRVKQAESDQIVSALQSKGVPVTYVVFPDEGHGFARPANNLAFTAAAEAFLAEHLGGRYQPIADDFAGSTITVPTGADQVPGLAPALAAMPQPRPTAEPN